MDTPAVCDVANAKTTKTSYVLLNTVPVSVKSFCLWPYNNFIVWCRIPSNVQMAN